VICSTNKGDPINFTDI